MAFILSIETASEGCSVSLQSDEEILSSITLFEDKKSATYLTTIIDQCLNNTAIQISELNAIAVSKGPGSYTGLRVGVSTAKGLCMALDTPLISYNTLEGLAEQIQEKQDKYLCPMLDARRDEVYCLIKKNDTIFLDTQAVVLTEDSFSELLENNKVLFFGSGAIKAKKIISNKNAVFLESIIKPNAQAVNKMVFNKFLNEEFEDLAAFEPFYLKEFIAKKSKKVLPN